MKKMTNKELFVKYWYPGLHMFRDKLFKYTKDGKEISYEEFNELFYEYMIRDLKQKEKRKKNAR